MAKGHQMSVIEYENTGESPLDIALIPLVVYRDYHHLSNEYELYDIQIRTPDESVVKIFRGQMPPICLTAYGAGFTGLRDIYRQFEFAKETYRGLDDQEDCLSIGRFHGHLERKEKIIIVCSLSEALSFQELHDLKNDEIKRLKEIPGKEIKDQFIKDLMIRGDQFCVYRPSTKTFTLIAGYHWFTDWGRDTMIAMRGLVIARGMQKEARSIIENFLMHERNGLIPNRFPDIGEQPEYNTVDATLWLFVAMYEYYRAFNDKSFVEKTYDQLDNIIKHHIKGTDFGIHIKDNCLLYSGAPGYQLTWMDAKVDGIVVTPREGAAVEINALWYNTLCIHEEFSRVLKREFRYKEVKEKVKQSFESEFLLENGSLADVLLTNGQKDESIRPNMVYALSLPFPLIDKVAGKKVLAVIKEHLYTPLGLRSLSNSDPSFVEIYGGNRWERDHAYHQGTVWSYLWGEYASAFCYVNSYSEKVYSILRKEVETLEQHFYNADGIKCISEIFDGDEPNNGRGCIQQAWSVGNILWSFLKIDWKKNNHDNE